MPGVFVTLDPGQRTGVAIWRADFFPRLEAPIGCQLWTPGAGAREWSWSDRCLRMAERIRVFLREYPVKNVYCELPAFFEGEKGHAAAAKGDVVKLSYLVGVYAGICHTRGVPFQLVPVREWKGQLSKSIVKARIQRKLGGENCGNYRGDIWDAVGIGLYVKGFFK